MCDGWYFGAERPNDWKTNEQSNKCQIRESLIEIHSNLVHIQMMRGGTQAMRQHQHH